MTPNCLQQILPSFTPRFANCTFPSPLLVLSSSISRYVSREKRKINVLISRCQFRFSTVIRSIFFYQKRADWVRICYLSIQESLL